MSLVLGDDELVVGAPGTEDKRGRAYRFERGDEEWELAGEIAPPASDKRMSPRNGGYFANTVAAAAGTLFMSDLPGLNVGAVHVFDARGERRLATLRSPDAVELGFFGEAIVARGETVVVGSWQGGDPRHERGGGPGVAYVWTRDEAGSWSRTDRLAAPSSRPRDRFGWALAIADDAVAIGAPSLTQDSRVHLFEREAGGYVHAAEIAPPGETAASSFGAALALTDEFLFVGDPDHPGGGRVHVYRRQ